MQTKPGMLLVAGGARDPNIIHFMKRLTSRNVPHYALLTGQDACPGVTWDIDSDTLVLNGTQVSPTALFMRHDVFESMNDTRPEVGHRALAWYNTLSGWAEAHPRVNYLNRKMPYVASNKPHALLLARQCGLNIPETLITNDLTKAQQHAAIDKCIVKPVSGGGYCEDLIQSLTNTPQINNLSASPAIVQTRMHSPEYRVYVIGEHTIGFRLDSNSLDYRVTQDATITKVPVPEEVIEPLKALVKKLGLNFGAADFKTDTRNKTLRFLELNTGPMFAAFDKVADGAISDAFIDVLT